MNLTGERSWAGRLVYPAVLVVAILSGAPPVEAQCQGYDALLPFVPASGWPNGWQGFVRVDNARHPATGARFVATDDAGNSYRGSFDIGSGETLHFNSNDLEFGNADKGVEGIGRAPIGSWRLCFTSLGRASASAYVRTSDGFVTDVSLIVETSYVCEPRCPEWRVPIFNPASNYNQVSLLRLINNSDATVGVVITGIRADGTQNLDGDGEPRTVQGFIGAGMATEITSEQLETGREISLERCDPAAPEDCVDTVGALGPAKGKWSLYVNRLEEGAYSEDLVVMNLLRTPTGQITSLPASGTDTWIRR